MRRDDLRLLLAAVRRRWQGQVRLRAVGRAAAIAAAPLVGAAVIAKLLPLGDGALALLIAAGILAAVAGVIAVIRTVPRRPDDRQLARFIEERAASHSDGQGFDDVLVSAVETIDSSEPYRELILENALRRLDRVTPSAVLPSLALRRAALEAVAGVGVLALAVVMAWPVLGRAVEFAWIAVFPQSIQVEVLPGDSRVVAGKPLSVRASVRAGHRLLTRFTPKLTVKAGSEERSVGMTPDGSGFQFSFESIDRSFVYHVTAGSARSSEYTVTALYAPRVKQIDLHYAYPAFANLAPREEKNGGDIYAPAGTSVHVRVHTDKPIASGQLALRGAAASGLQRTGDRVVEGDLVLAKDDSYRIGLTDADGLQSSGDTEYFIRVMDDRPPDVRILRPGGDQQITPLEEVAIEARAEDDYGISRFDLVYVVAGRPPVVVPFDKPNGSDLHRVGTHVLQAEDLRVQPGDVITYYARARDVARGKRATEARSDMFFLEVRPFSEEFVMAQSQGMSGMSGEQIEALISAQKEIINATWNIERRAGVGAGRSLEDLTAVASAQADLKTRAEQLAPPARSRSPFRGPQQVGLPQGQGQARALRSIDPVGAAIDAMDRAVSHLQGQRTADALPHEMAALQGLLQAQAEIRRREVQQTGAGMGGLGRQGQDLSALFDKELQRQQRTNYENRQQVEQPAEREDSRSAADRIRDLARRQEELSRLQRQLAGARLPADEMKRQLEKLTREQEALRQEAEDISRQMARTGQPQQGQKGGDGAQTSGGMRDVTEQMRNATGDLQRQSPGDAADRAQQAAARLRSLEQQMRADSPESRQRAAGELRLEAQQIADEQRRIAGEADRLEKSSGDSAADAWRRLAGEKDKLADRVDELRRGAEQLAGAAAREIQREQVAERMRDGAKQMRDSSTQTPSTPPKPRKLAEGEQQIARALDRVVDQLGGGEGAQDLARQLDETRGIRARLDSLERRIRDVESRDARARQGRGAAPNARGSAASDASGASKEGTSKELQQLRDEYAKEAQRARETLSRLDRNQPGPLPGGISPEQHEWSPTDQGTEAFKQDFSNWESLKQNVESALDRYDASIISRATRKALDDRLSAGGSERVPDAYRALIARYYESLAKKK